MVLQELRIKWSEPSVDQSADELTNFIYIEKSNNNIWSRRNDRYMIGCIFRWGGVEIVMLGNIATELTTGCDERVEQTSV